MIPHLFRVLISSPNLLLAKMCVVKEGLGPACKLGASFAKISTKLPETTRLHTFSMASAVLTGTVDFSTTIFELLDSIAIILAAPSQ